MWLIIIRYFPSNLGYKTRNLIKNKVFKVSNNE